MKMVPVCFGKLQMVGEAKQRRSKHSKANPPIYNRIEMKIKGDVTSDWHSLGSLTPQLPESFYDKNGFDVLKNTTATFILSDNGIGGETAYQLRFEIPKPDKPYWLLRPFVKPTITVSIHGKTHENDPLETPDNVFQILFSLVNRITNLPAPTQKAVTDLLVRGYKNYYHAVMLGANLHVSLLMQRLKAIRADVQQRGCVPQDDIFYRRLLESVK